MQARLSIHRRAILSVFAVVAFAGHVASATAQPVEQGTERLDSTRPEAWALRYFTATTLLGTFTVPVHRDAGSIMIGGEAGWIPFLTEDQRRVGFNGSKVEDLNKAPVFFRPRVMVGLPGRLAATVAFVPPVETFDVTPKLLAGALEGAVYQSPVWNVGWRGYAQTGTARSAFTCSAEAASFVPGTPQNGLGCLDPSSDTATLRYVGVEMIVGQSASHRRVAPHLAFALDHFDNRIAVNAHRFDLLNGVRQEYVDRTIQTSRSMNVSLTGGAAFALGRRVETAVDVFYAPLWVRRNAGASTRNDGLLNAKALLTYRVR